MPKTAAPKRLKGNRAFKLIQAEVLAALDAGEFNCDVYERFKDRFPASLSQFNRYVAQATAKRDQLEPTKPPAKAAKARVTPALVPVEAVPTPAPVAPAAPVTPAAPAARVPPPPPLEPAAKPRRFQNQSRDTEELF